MTVAMNTLSPRRRLALSLGLALAALALMLAAPGLTRDIFFPPSAPGQGWDSQPLPEGGGRQAGFFRVTLPGVYRLGLEGPGRLYLDGQIRINAGSGAGPHLVRAWLSPGRHLLEVDQLPGQPPGQVLFQPPAGQAEPLPASALHPPAQPLSRARAEALGESARQALTPPALALVWLGFAALLLIRLKDRALLTTLLLSSLAMALAIWLSSGTMAVYGASLGRPQVHFPCEYLVNSDHSKFVATLHLLDGEPRWLWETSVVLRRILYPLIAYLPMKALGFMGGGLVVTLALHLLALLTWGQWVKRRLGEGAARWGLWLLALYPGIYYWSGLPYSYAMIVPCSLWCFMALERLGREQTTRGLALWSAALGALFLGYDLIFFYAPAATLLVWWSTRSLARAALTWPGLLLPTAACLGILSALGAYSADPSHEPIAVLQSYLAWPDWAAWGQALLKAPLDLIDTYFSSNFLVLPALFLLLWLAGRRMGIRLERPEVCLLLSAFLVWAVINLAPPYTQWHRGAYNSARFYQPVFAAMTFHCLRLLGSAGQKKIAWPRWAALIALGLSAAISLGALFTTPLAEYAYWRFYQQHAWGALGRHLDQYGRRPLGICPPEKVIPPPGFKPQAPKER